MATHHDPITTASTTVYAHPNFGGKNNSADNTPDQHVYARAHYTSTGTGNSRSNYDSAGAHVYDHAHHNSNSAAHTDANDNNNTYAQAHHSSTRPNSASGAGLYARAHHASAQNTDTRDSNSSGARPDPSADHDGSFYEPVTPTTQHAPTGVTARTTPVPVTEPAQPAGTTAPSTMVHTYVNVPTGETRPRANTRGYENMAQRPSGPGLGTSALYESTQQAVARPQVLYTVTSAQQGKHARNGPHALSRRMRENMCGHI